MTKKITPLRAIQLGILKGIGMDALTFRELLYGLKEAGKDLFSNPYNGKFDRQGNYYNTDIIKAFAEKGHPENKKITAMAKKFQNKYGNVPLVETMVLGTPVMLPEKDKAGYIKAHENIMIKKSLSEMR